MPLKIDSKVREIMIFEVNIKITKSDLEIIIRKNLRFYVNYKNSPKNLKSLSIYFF